MAAPKKLLKGLAALAVVAVIGLYAIDALVIAPWRAERHNTMMSQAREEKVRGDRFASACHAAIERTANRRVLDFSGAGATSIYGPGTGTVHVVATSTGSVLNGSADFGNGPVPVSCYFDKTGAVIQVSGR